VRVSSDRRRSALPLRRLLPLLLLPPIAACATLSPLEAVRATPDEVTFAYSDGRGDDAARQAALYCANLGRSARLREVTREGADRHVTRFACE
jgi:hypothetical protein